jgi:membrane associated rhomboid family serine protease
MNLEKKKFIYSLIVPGLFVLLIWIMKISEVLLNTDFAQLGIYPLRIENLHGIITSPLVHKDFNHLMANTVPLLVLGTGVFYFYRPVAFKVFILIYLLSGFWLWFGGRPGYHIGASGVIYGLAAFLFFSGIFRKSIRLMAISLLVAFLYGGFIWGVLPLDAQTSWEGHLFGGIAGVIIAFFYKNQGPQRKKYEWEIEEELEEKYGDWDDYDWEIQYYYDNKNRGDKKDENKD